MTKTELRNQFLSVRDKINDKDKKSDIISKKLLNIPKLKAARTVFCYVSFRGEVNTIPLIGKLIEIGKSVCVPVCKGRDGQMTAVTIRSLDELKCGAFGILEPACGSEVNKDEIDIAVVPGLVFGKNLHRIGYGKGYYDRFLCGFKGFKAGICFSECVTEELNADKYDIKLDAVITEEKTYYGSL